MEEVKAKLELTQGKENNEKQDKLLALYKQLQGKRMESLNLMMKDYKIKIEGDNVPEMLDCFNKMKAKYGLSDSFMQKVKKSGFVRPSPVQMQAIPIMFNRRDAIILAETGSGKSLAFITPLIHLHRKGDGLKAIIVVPTRELAIQLYKEFLMFCTLSKNTQIGDKSSARVKFLRKALIPKT